MVMEGGDDNEDAIAGKPRSYRTRCESC